MGCCGQRCDGECVSGQNNSLRLKPFLTGFVLLSVLMTAVIAVSVSVMLFEVQKTSEHEHNVTDLLVENVGWARREVIQIQQYLTDASATGEQDGIDDGKKALEQVNQALARITEIDPTLADDTQALSAKAQQLFDTGMEMVAAYKQSQAAGNVIMKRKGGFDDSSDSLQDALTLLEGKINQQQTETVGRVEKLLRLTRIITVGLSILIAVSILFGGRHLYQQVFRQLGGEPADGVSLAEKLSQGDLAQVVTVAPGDTRSLMAHLASMRARWTDVATSLNGQVWLMLNAFGQLRDQARTMSVNCGEQNEATLSILGSVEQVNSGAQQIAARAADANAQAQRSSESAQQGNRLIENMVVELGIAQTSVNASVSLVTALNRCVEEIEGLIARPSRMYPGRPIFWL